MCELARNPAVSTELLKPMLGELTDERDEWRTDLRRATQAEFRRFTLPQLLEIKGTGAADVVGNLAGGWHEGMADTISRADYEARLRQVEQTV